MKLETFKTRAGRAIPVMCDNTSAEDIVVFFFGCEYQDVYYCTKDVEVVKSSDMALMNEDEDAIFSAEYKAYPAKQDGDIVYNSILTTIPVTTDCDITIPE